MRRLASFRFTVCGAPGYLAQRGTPIQLAALAARNCLIFTDSPFGKEWRFWAADGSEQDVPLSGTFQAIRGGKASPSPPRGEDRACLNGA